MPYINIAQPNGMKPKHVNISLAGGHVVFTSDKDQFLLDAYDAVELGRMIREAGLRLRGVN